MFLPLHSIWWLNYHFHNWNKHKSIVHLGIYVYLICNPRSRNTGVNVLYNLGILMFVLGSSQVAQGKECACQCRRCTRPRLNSWVGKIPWQRKRQLIPVFLTGESPWAEEPGGLQSMQSQRAGHHWVTKHSTQHSLCLYDMVFSSFIINCIFLNFLKAILTLVSKFFYCYDPSPVS